MLAIRRTAEQIPALHCAAGSCSGVRKLVPKIVCPGCLSEMQYITLEPSPLKHCQTATFHCHECDADTKRELEMDKHELR